MLVQYGLFSTMTDGSISITPRGGFVLAQSVERCGLHRRLALRVVGALGPYPGRLVLGFFLAATSVVLDARKAE